MQENPERNVLIVEKRFRKAVEKLSLVVNDVFNVNQKGKKRSKNHL